MTFKIIVGKDDFLVEAEISKYKDPFSFDYEVIDNVGSLNTVLESSLFSDSKTVVLKDFKLNKEDKAKLISYLKMEYNNLLVVVFPELPKNDAIYKLAGKDLVTCQVTPAIVKKFIDKKSKELGVTWQSNAIKENFEFLVGQDLRSINSELLKLEGTLVTEQSLDSVIRCRQMIIFDLVKHIVNKDFLNFYISIEYFLQDGQDPIFLLSLMLKQFKQLIIVKYGGKLEISPYVLKVLKAQSKKFSQKELLKIYIEIDSLLYDIKIGKVKFLPIYITNIFRI